MAPTLLGRHLVINCQQCGYRFTIDTPQGHEHASVLGREKQGICTMCHFPNPLPRGRRISTGDRILVHKYIYSISEPKRWDVVVFKAPHTPQTNFIKRLVGLPGEELAIVEGNIYTKPLGAPENDWRIARKTDRPGIQHAVWQPVYHSVYVPLDHGTASPERTRFPWKLPWIPDDPTAWDLHEPRHVYRYNGSENGLIRFDFQNAGRGGPGLYQYNQFRRRGLHFEAVEDVRIAGQFEPHANGLAVTLRTTSRMGDPRGFNLGLAARIGPQGNATLSIETRNGKTIELARLDNAATLSPGQAHQIELWYVDQEASLWLNGSRLLTHRFDLPLEQIKNRALPAKYPKISIELAGPPTNVYRVEIDRDLYYSGISPNGTIARGALLKSEGRPKGQPIRINQDQFVCLGDNSPLSHDSRYWDRINPWVEQRMFINHTHNDTGDQAHLGLVPRQLMMGRAFFVYFPALLSIKSDLPGIIPNFGLMRFIH